MIDQNFLDAVAVLVRFAEGNGVEPTELGQAIAVARQYGEGEGVAFISEEEDESPTTKIGLDTSDL